jgi:hypothetical protein
MWRVLLCAGLGLAMLMGGNALAQDKAGKDNYTHGKIVKVNPDKDSIIIRTNDGVKTKELEYKVNKSTKFWGPDKAPLSEGLRAKALKEGADVWYVVSGTDNQMITEARLFNPAQPPDKNK